MGRITSYLRDSEMNRHKVTLEGSWQIIIVPPTGYDIRSVVALGNVPRCEAIARAKVYAQLHHVKLKVAE